MVDVLSAAGIFAGLVVCLEVGYLFGHRSFRKKSETPDQVGTIQGAMLGMLALLLGFSFAQAASRFSDRVQLISAEANAIGTAWLRCDLLPDAARRELRDLMRAYTDKRIASYEARNDSEWEATIAAARSIQNQIWAVVADGAKAAPAFAAVLLSSFNEMFDVEGVRVAAARRHLPPMILLLLFTSSVVGVSAVGYGCGVAGKRNLVLTTSLTFLIAGVLWAIVDMDHPRKGLIQAGQQPLLDLKKAQERPNPGSAH